MHHLSTFSDDHNLPHHHQSHPHHHQRHDTGGGYTYGGPECHSVGGAGSGSAGRPGYAISEISCSDYTASSSSRKDERRQSGLILLIFVVDFALVVLVIVLEYFLRWTEAFPLRRQNFTCSDVSITCSSRDKALMSEFAFHARVSDTAVYSLSFCTPVLVVVIGEVGLCTMSGDRRRSITMMDRTVSVPHFVRRLLRFLGVFVFGGFSVMVIVDVTSNMIGRLRPDFLEMCRVNVTLCGQPYSLDDSACLNTDSGQVRQARKSFPSLHSALTFYAASFLSVYIHGALRSQSVRILRGFLTLAFLLLSLMVGLAEYCRCVSHWTDVVVGLALGAVMALYLTVCVLNQFQEHVTQAEIYQMMRAFITDAYFPYEDRSHLTRPFSDQLASLTVPRIPSMPDGPLSSVVTPSAAGLSQSTAALAAEAGKQHQRRRPFTLFQRDLSQTVEYHRRHQSHLHAGSTSNM